uniref:Group II intron maturase-specific domain-containing protein n=1 Tax=Boodleopsis pusilla TaxID=381415 RepID=A0A386AZE5_9CHLO|nr:hypothetical protein [Boodleopsis pusilla]AYC64820.1 hypothetical protein [Boodleopsis pusilla]
MKKNSFINWTYAFQKLIKFQKKIVKNQKNFRNCRNFQRLLRKTSFIQLLIIKEIFHQNIYFFMDLRKFRFFLQQKMHHQLWLLALSPIYHYSFFIDGKNPQLYPKLCRFFQQPTTHSILISQFSNFFNKKTKKWLLANVCIEKKYFLQRFIQTTPKSPEYDHFKKIIKNIIIFKFITFFLQYHLQYNLQQNFLEYNGFLLISLQTQKNRSMFSKYFDSFTQKFGPQISFLKIYTLCEGLHFMGWFFLKNSTHFSGRISSQNLYHHQKDIHKYLKNSALKTQPMDQIIYTFNRKILYWQKFYNESMKFSHTCSQMNHFLFCQIWLWMKKRHRKKSSQWLYNRYWKRSINHQWVFSVNNETLVFYRKGR